jgi:hypothetical protein
MTISLLHQMGNVNAVVLIGVSIVSTGGVIST